MKLRRLEASVFDEIQAPLYSIGRINSPKKEKYEND